MKEKELMQIINNILYEVVTKTDISAEDYIPWLKLEVGMSDEMLETLEKNNCLPKPNQL